MKISTILGWGIGAILGIAFFAALGSYCWLYSWSWGGTPAPHASLSAVEAQKLHDFDIHIAKQLPDSLRMRMKREMEALAAAWIEYEDGELTSINDSSDWFESMKMRYSCDVASRTLLNPARESLHRLLENGSLAADACFLAALALQMQDIPLVRFLVEKGVNPESPFMDINGYLLSEIMLGSNGEGEYLPVKERIALLDWMLARGVNIQAVEEERVLLMSEYSLTITDDSAGAILDWFLRHGYKLNPARASLILLRGKEALPTYQQLIKDGFLPQPPQEIELPDVHCTPLQCVAGAILPVPDTLRWLLAQGHNPNALPTGADTPASEDEGEETPRILRKTPIDACLETMRYATPGKNTEEDARLRGKVEILDILLQHGAVPTAETRELLPLDRVFDKKIKEIFRKHGFHLDAGENPYNACCVPE